MVTDTLGMGSSDPSKGDEPLVVLLGLLGLIGLVVWVFTDSIVMIRNQPGSTAAAGTRRR